MELIPFNSFRCFKLNFQEDVLNPSSLIVENYMIALTEKSKKSLGNKEDYAALPNNMLKVFHCLYHDLTISEFILENKGMRVL